MTQFNIFTYKLKFFKQNIQDFAFKTNESQIV